MLTVFLALMNNVFVCSNTTLESLDICPNRSILIHIKKHCPDTRCNKMVPLNKTMYQLTISVEKTYLFASIISD